MKKGRTVRVPPFFNVRLMKLFIVNQRVSDTPSKIRGGQGALMPQEEVL